MTDPKRPFRLGRDGRRSGGREPLRQPPMGTAPSFTPSGPQPDSPDFAIRRQSERFASGLVPTSHNPDLPALKPMGLASISRRPFLKSMAQMLFVVPAVWSAKRGTCSITLTMYILEGGGWPQITARLWMLWSELVTGRHQMEQGAVTVTGSNTVNVSFNSDCSNLAVSRSIGFSVQESSRVPFDTGWLFRSGSFDTLPTGPIEIVIAGPRDIPGSELPGMLPATPFDVDPNDPDTKVTAFAATLAQGGIDFTATGTTKKTGVVVGFRYTGRLVLFPSADVAAAETEAIGVTVSNPVMVFLPGPSVTSAIEAELMNLLRVFIMHEVGPQIRTGIENRVNAGIIASMSREFPGGVWPPGVILSVRAVAITPTYVRVVGALGAFGGVWNKFPPITASGPTGGGSGFGCFIATAVHGMNSREVTVLRAFRDRCLSPNPTGRKLVALYEQLSPNIAALISTRPFLKSVVRVLVVAPAVWIARRRLGRR